jgi:geranylgeranyl pyrophosphate synthase
MRDYAHHLGLAFQIADDVLDYTASAEELGKPAGSDLKNGVVTLPALYYLEPLPADAPERRIVEEGGDVSAVIEAIRASTAPARALAHAHGLAEQAAAALDVFPSSAERSSLLSLAAGAVSRRA